MFIQLTEYEISHKPTCKFPDVLSIPLYIFMLLKSEIVKYIFIALKMTTLKYNPDAKYSVGPNYHTKNMNLDELEVYVTEKKYFKIKVVNPFKHYLNPFIKSDATVNRWNSNPLQFYQNQLNFAIFCSTTGCGVSYVNHFNHSDPLTRSVYRFHVYYQFRRILSELSVPLYGEKSHNPFNNPIDIKAFQRLSNEFNISTRDFRQKLDKNHGMGSLYVGIQGVHNLYNYDYWPGVTSFNPKAREVLKSIEQKHPNAWTTFVLDLGTGFTQAGVERLNDSIRTYVWCILSAQAQSRANIIESFGAQKQCLTNLENAINSAEDLPSSIERYQNTLRYARSKVDYVIGYNLYMIPSDLQLQIGTITNYNNEIVIATSEQNLGLNPSINDSHKNTVVKAPPSPTPPSPLPLTDAEKHESTKTALVVGGIAIGLIFLYFSN